VQASSRIRPDILDEHAEEIEILWARRRDALWSHRETLESLEDLERRLDAHIDGLALDAEGAHECFARGLEGDDADAAFAAAAALLRQRTAGARERVHAAEKTASAGARRGIHEAIGFENPRPHVALQHRVDGARAACADPATATSTALFELGCLGVATDVAAIVRAARVPTLMEPAVRALGSLGLPAAVEALIALMETGAGPAAGVAFTRITGIEAVLRGDAPTDDDETFEETRPWPDAEATRARWESVSEAHTPDERRLHGRAIDEAAWLDAPHAGDLLTRREQIVRLRSRIPSALAKLDLDARAREQRSSAP